MHEEATKVWAGTWMVRVVWVLLYSQLGLDVLLLCQLAQSPLVVSYQSLCVCVGGGGGGGGVGGGGGGERKDIL